MTSTEFATETECGSPQCGCTSAVHAIEPGAYARADIRINGQSIPVGPGENPETLREKAWAELLRQEAVRLGWLTSDPDEASALTPAQQQAVIEDMLDVLVQSPEPDEAACRRYYEAHAPRFIQGQRARVRHILFAVTPGVPVQALAERAESALLELSHAQVPAGQFGQMARSLSNCPSGAQGGDLGWIGPHDCAPELSRFLFMQAGGLPLGLHPRLVHTRYGLHIVDVLEQQAGEAIPVETLLDRIAAELRLQSRATALRQYMRQLEGQAHIEGIELEGADTPLVQ